MMSGRPKRLCKANIHKTNVAVHGSRDLNEM